MRQQGSECRSSSWCSFALQASGSENAKHSRGCDTSECDEVKATEAGIIRGGGERLKEVGIFGAKFAAVNFGGGPLARLLGKVGRLLGFAGKEVSLGAKIEGQMGKRGWSREMVGDAVNSPARTVVTRDTRYLPGGGRMNDPTTAYYHRNGGYVVRNDRTGDVVQVSDRTDTGWIAPWD